MQVRKVMNNGGRVQGRKEGGKEGRKEGRKKESKRGRWIERRVRNRAR